MYNLVSKVKPKDNALQPRSKELKGDITDADRPTDDYMIIHALQTVLYFYIFI